MVSVSVIIAARNRPEELRRLLESLHAQTLQPAEVVVVDDGSQPPLPQFSGPLQLRNDVPRGACQARNLGFRNASAEYVFIFDDDAEVRDTSLLERAVALAEKFPGVGAVAFRQLTSEGKTHWMQPAPGEEIRLVPSFFGFGALIVRTAFEAVGGFFEPLGYYCEEDELALKLIDHGFLVLYDPSLQVVHHEHGEGRDYRIIHRLTWRNMMYITVARYPIVLVPPALAMATLRWIRLARAWNEFRFQDVAWGVSSLIRRLPELISHHQAVRLKTLKERRLWRNRVVAPPLLDAGSLTSLAGENSPNQC
jgi:GT2 family glycosyltransferase